MVRIGGPGAPGSINTPRPTAKKRGSAASSAAGSEQVSVADAASLHEKAQVMLAQMDEVRMEQIEQIRDALEKGNYQFDSRKVAARIVVNALAEHPW